jgi:hypothetical protein
MSLVGIETTIPASERPQTNALDRAVAGVQYFALYKYMNWQLLNQARICIHFTRTKLISSINLAIDVSDGKKPLRVLRRISVLILCKLCVKRIRCTIKLSGLARIRPIVSSYALNQSINKAGSTLPELAIRNYHVRSQALAVHSKYNVRCTRIETRFLLISRNPQNA